MKQLLKRYPLSICCIVAILFLSLMPVKEMHLENVSLSDKWAHFIMYGGLSLVVWFEQWKRNRLKISLGTLLLYALLCPVVLGILMELAQAYLTDYRSGDVLDAIANSLGALIVTFFFVLLRKFMR